MAAAAPWLSTATTLCAFLPMLFRPGVAGQFMGMLPVTLIFVLSASLVVALIYLPVMGGVSGRLSRRFEFASDFLIRHFPWWVRAALVGDTTAARLCRQHNDANVIALGQRLTGIAVALDCVDSFMETEFEGGRHARRVAKLSQPDDMA